ncbi:MAG: BamA/TamA family outer membrane protein [Planctomycetes bacterium]|nr:BamA/TamA family outer membrane protein [Planctomycetota bacterium]
MATPVLVGQTVAPEARGRPVISIDLSVKSRGEVFEREPESALRHTIISKLRTRVAREFKEGEIKKDIKYLTTTSHLFRSAEYEVTYDQELQSARIKFIVEQPLVSRIRGLAPYQGSWSEDGLDDFWRSRSALDTAVDSEFSIRRLDGDVKRLYKTGGFLDVRAEYKYTAKGVDIVLRVIQNEALAMLTFSGVYRSGFEKDLKLIISGDKAVRSSFLDEMPGAPKLPAFFPTKAFTGDIITDANPANILGAARRMESYYRIKGNPFVEVKPRVVSVPHVFNKAELRENYRLLNDDSIERIAELIEDGLSGKTVLIFEVYEGETVLIGDVRFEGLEGTTSPGDSDALDASRLTGFLSFATSFWYEFLTSDAEEQRAVLAQLMRLQEGDEFVESDAVRDAEALETYFHKRGWLDADVTFTNFEFNETRSRVNLVYHVQPGPVYAVHDIRIEYQTESPRVPDGAAAREYDKPAVSFDEIFEMLELEVEQLSDEFANEAYTQEYVSSVQDTRRGKYFSAHVFKEPIPWDEYVILSEPGKHGSFSQRLQILLAQNGFSNIRVEITRIDTYNKVLDTDWDMPLPVRQCGMVIRLRQGFRSIVGDITFRGNVETKESVARRLVSLAPGEEYNRNQLLLSELRLRRSQWFEAAVAGQGVTSSSSNRLVNEDGEIVEYTDIEFDLVEGRTNSFNFSAGFNTSTGFTASIDLRLNNFDIAGLYEWIWGPSSFSGAGQSLSLTLQPPLDRQQRYSLSFVEPWVYGYPVSGAGSIVYQVSDLGEYSESTFGIFPWVGWRALPDVEWRWGYNYEIRELFDVSGAARAVIDESKNTLSTLWTRISWNTTDSPIFPTRGFDMWYRFDYTGGMLGGTLDFWRMRTHVGYYLPLFDIDRIRTTVLAFEFNAAWQDVHSNTDEIPFLERFKLGGSGFGNTGTLRGFAFQGVGPSINGQPEGGNFGIWGFTEFRVPIFPGSLWIVGFVDAGILTPTLNTFDPAGFTVSGGFGLRLLLPILPVPFALDFGFPIIKHPGNEEEIISINLGFGF